MTRAADSARRRRRILRRRGADGRPRGRRQGAAPHRRRNAREPRRRLLGVVRGAKVRRALGDADLARAAPVSATRCACPCRAARAARRAGRSARCSSSMRPVVEGASIDEWYMDLGGTEGLYAHEPLAATARAHSRRGRRTRPTLSVSIGGGTSKLVAKLAVERAKPKPGTGATGVHVVAPGDEARFLETFDLADIPLVGPRFQERLAKLGMRRVPDVLPVRRRRRSTQWLGAREAAWLYDRVRGIDHGEVEAPRRREEHQPRRNLPRRHRRRRRAGARAARARHARRDRSSRRRPDRAHRHRAHSRLRFQDASGEPDARRAP